MDRSEILHAVESYRALGLGKEMKNVSPLSYASQ